MDHFSLARADPFGPLIIAQHKEIERMAYRRPRKRMYAVMADGIGIIAGTMAYSRRAAISHFLDGGTIKDDWEAFKRSGYRTIECCIETWIRGQRIRQARR